MDRLTRITNSSLLEAELSYKLRGCFFNVYNLYGHGLKEIIYQKALVEEFEKQKIKHEQQKRIEIYSLESGKKLGLYIPDFLIEGKIIVEIKSTPMTLSSFIRQQRSYLRASKFEIGFLVNFGGIEIDIRRSIFTNDRKQFISKLHNS